MRQLYFSGIAILVLSIVFSFSTDSAYAKKSVYAITDHDASTLKAYEIQGDQIQFQEYVEVDDYAFGAVDVTCDSNSEHLFITYEGSTRIVWASAKTLQQEGYIDLRDYNPSVESLAGIVADEEKQTEYVVGRSTNNLYILSWNEDEERLVLMDPDNPTQPYTEGNAYVTLENMDYAYGLSVDGNRLYVTNNTSTIHFYDTDTWTHLGTRNVGRKAMDIAVDPNNGEHPAYLYAGGFQPPAGGGSHTYLIKHNLEDPNSGNHIEKDIGAVAIGLAVDPDTGLVYVTIFDNGKVCVYDCSSSDPNDFTPTDCEDNQGSSGPAGICVPTGNVNYKYPLPVSKTDNVNPDDCVSPDAADPNVTYTIHFFPNEHYNCAVVVTDFLPWGVDFLAADPSYYVHDPLSHTLTWDIGDLPAYDPQDPDPNIYFHITVRVNSLAEPLSAIVNPVEIESYASYSVDIGTNPICFWDGNNPIIYA